MKNVLVILAGSLLAKNNRQGTNAQSGRLLENLKRRIFG